MEMQLMSRRSRSCRRINSITEELQETKADLEETKNSLTDAKKLLSSKVERERALSCEDEATLKQQSSTPKQYAKVDDTEHDAEVKKLKERVKFLSGKGKELLARFRAAQNKVKDLERQNSQLKVDSNAQKEVIQDFESEAKVRRAHQTTRKILHRLRKILKTRHGIYGKVVKNLEDWFNAFDKNHDGQISTAEFSQALKRMDLGLTKEQIEHVIQEIDANHDGHIDKKEFLACMGTPESIMIVEINEKDHQIRELNEKLAKCDERINELTTAAAESMVHTGDKESLLNEMEEKYNLLKKKH